MLQAEPDHARDDQGERADEQRATFGEPHVEMVRVTRRAGLAGRGAAAGRCKTPRMGSRRLLALLAVVVVVVVVAGGVFLLTRSDDGSPASTMALGLQDDALLTSAEPLAVPTVTRLAPKLIRYNIVWSDIAPTRPAAPGNPADPAYVWTNADKIVALAAKLGASLLFTIVDAPKWANGGATPEHVPTDPADFGTFCGVVAQRYPTVGRFTIWNEPNRGQFLQPQGAGGTEAPRRLAGLAKACIPAIHAQSPDAAGRDRPHREPRRTGRPCADPVPRRLPRGRRPEARRHRAQPLPRGSAPALRPHGATRGRRRHRAQPRLARGRAEAGVRRHDADLAHRVRRPDGAAGDERRPGDAAARDRRARADALPVRAAADLVPAARPGAARLLAVGPRRHGLARRSRPSPSSSRSSSRAARGRGRDRRRRAAAGRRRDRRRPGRAASGSPAAGRGIAIPGLVDLQVNGFAGVDLAHADAAGYALVAERLAAVGHHLVPGDVRHRERARSRARARAGAAIVSRPPGRAPRGPVPVARAARGAPARRTHRSRPRRARTARSGRPGRADDARARAARGARADRSPPRRTASSPRSGTRTPRATRRRARSTAACARSRTSSTRCVRCGSATRASSGRRSRGRT